MENKIQFSLELYNSGEYDVVTREGKPVKIAGVNQEVKEYQQILGWLNGASQGWSINGAYRSAYCRLLAISERKTFNKY